eukprot:5804417-Alexandrium_andersonii.AAC.1
MCSCAWSALELARGAVQFSCAATRPSRATGATATSKRGAQRPGEAVLARSARARINEHCSLQRTTPGGARERPRSLLSPT